MSTPTARANRPRAQAVTLAIFLCAGATSCGSADGGGGSGGSSTLTVGISAPGPGGNMLQLGIAQTEKYFADEGLTVKAIYLGTSGKVLQALATGKIDLGLSTPDLLIQAAERGQDARMIYNWTTKNVSRFGVLPGSDIRRVADLKGKTVGVADLSSGPAQMARASIQSAGLDPDKDVKFVAVGTGAPALDALTRGRIDTLIAYDTLFAGMTTNAGTRLRYIKPQGVDDLFSSSFVTSDSWAKAHQREVEGFGRAWAKATVYSFANPKAGVRMMFETDPKSKVGSSEAAATKSAMAQYNARLSTLYGGKAPTSVSNWGSYPQSAVKHWLTYSKSTGLSKGTADPSDLYTNRYVKAYNAFDPEDVRADAKKAKGATP